MFYLSFCATVFSTSHLFALGSVALFRENLYHTEQTIKLIQQIQNSRRHSNLPLFPFTHSFAHGVDTVLTAHVVVPAIDNDLLMSQITGEKIGVPASLSKKMLTDVLRGEMGFTGLVITDALDMGAIANNFEPRWVVEHVLLAGADIALMPVHVWDQESVAKLEEIYSYLEQRSFNNPELKKRIYDSAVRVVAKKSPVKYLLIR